MKQDSMKRYGKIEWSKMNLEQIDIEIRVHLENMVLSKNICEYWNSHNNRINYLINIRQEHVNCLFNQSGIIS